MTKNKPTLLDIRHAHQLIRPYIHHTPVFSSQQINEQAGCEVLFKCENLQKVGAFKARGGINATLSLDHGALKRGVATHSSGNHAQAVALAAQIAGVPAYIVMPENATRVKVEAVKGYGAEVIYCDATLAARESTLEEVIARTRATLIHPYDDNAIITGQATAALEVLEGLEVQPDYILTPVGGGGLLSGTALLAHYLAPSVKVMGCEPEGADDAYRSFRKGEWQPQTNPQTIADGLRTSLGKKPFAIIKEHVSDILCCNDEEIIVAMKLVWERMKLVIEPSAAVPLAALLKHRDVFAGKRVVIIISGGNVDLGNLPF